MDAKKELETLQDIRNIMERSSRFISLSGWSGVAAGICALVGAAVAYPIVSGRQSGYLYTAAETRTLLFIAAATFVAAFLSAFFFTYIRTKRSRTNIWNHASRRLFWNVMVPILAGSIFLLKLISLGHFGLVAPGCLLFYGIALFAGSKDTLYEIRYLGYAEMLLGCVALWFLGYGLFFWTIGFGVFHILYGIWMWAKYERK